MDDQCIREVCSAPFRGVTWDRVVHAIQRENGRHDLRVAYEIILDHKQAKQRTAEVMMLMQVRPSVRPSVRRVGGWVDRGGWHGGRGLTYTPRGCT